MYKMLETIGINVILDNSVIKVSTKHNPNTQNALSLDILHHDMYDRELYKREHDKSGYSFITNTTHFGDVSSSAITKIESSDISIIKNDMYVIEENQFLNIHCDNESVNMIKTTTQLNKVIMHKYWEINEKGEFVLNTVEIEDRYTGRVLKVKNYVKGEVYSSESISVDEHDNIKSIRSTTFEENPEDNFYVVFKFTYQDGRLKSVRKIVNNEQVSSIRIYYNKSGVNNIKYFAEGNSYPIYTIEFVYDAEHVTEYIYKYDFENNMYSTERQRKLYYTPGNMRILTKDGTR